MNQYLSLLTRITGGSLARVLTMERLNAMQDAIHALARGENLLLGLGLRKGPGMGRLKIDLDRKSEILRGVASATRDPWQPTIFTEGDGEDVVYKARFNLGTVNNVPATNWNDAFTIPDEEDTFHFIILTITSASGDVTGLTISVAATAPSGDDVAEDIPPTTHKIVLGAIGKSGYKMIVRHNISLVGVEVFRKTKAAPAVGAEPFNRWYRWENSEAAS